MAKKAKTQSSTKSKAEQAHEALARYLSNGKYWHRDDLADKLQKDGFAQRVGYVMTKARRTGYVVVLGTSRGTYSAQPSGVEVLKDLRKRRKVSYAWIRNVQAVAAYATSNWGRVSKGLTSAQQTTLRAEIAYIQRMVPYILNTFKRAGLN